MVSEVNNLIYNALAEYGAVALPGIGTLSVVVRSAQRNGNRVVAPCRVVEFSSELCGRSLVDIIASIASVAEAEARDIYARWIDKVKGDNELNISGVGVLRNKSFIADKELLSALNIASSEPIGLTLRRRSWSIVLPLIALVAGGVGYLIYSNSRVVATADEPVASVHEVVVPVVIEEPANEETPISEPVAPASWTQNENIRHWVVVGSYSTDDNAERAVADILEKKLADDCQIFVLGKMYAVAVFGSDDKAECDSFVRDNRSLFKQAWVHTPKRFK